MAGADDQALAVKPLSAIDPAAVGPYALLGRLGAGGMGTVYLGRAGDGQLVAVKLIRAELAEEPEFRARFRREVAAVRTVDGFCTASVLDADPDGEQPYLVTEYIPGPTLHQKVRADGPLPPDALKQLAVAVASALTAIHRAGVVHLDLKPSNVLLSATGPKVIDFGIARAADTTTARSRSGQAGTPAFMAPEQITHDGISPAADVFAWGGLVAFAGTGREPFGASTPPHVHLYRIVHEQARLDGLEPGLRRLVETAMAKDQAARPSARELLLDLLGEQPAPGRPPAPAGADGPAAAAGRAAQDEPTAEHELAGEDDERTGGPATVEFGPPSPPPSQRAPFPPAPFPPAASRPAPSRPGRRRRARLLAAVAVVAVLALAATAATWLASRHGSASPAAAAAADQTAAASLRDVAANPGLARRLAVAAYHLAPTARAREAVVAAGLTAARPEIVTDGTGQTLAVTFAPDSRALATASTGPSAGKPRCPAGSTASGERCVIPGTVTCPAGPWTSSGGQCVTPGTVTCPDDMTRRDGQCAAAPRPECRTGGTLSGQTCLSPPVCPDGTTLEGRQCVSDPVPAATCPPPGGDGGGGGRRVDQSSCPTTPECPAGLTLSSGRCVAQPTCPSGTLTSSGCSRPAVLVCAAGTLSPAGDCVARVTTVCPAGSSTNSAAGGGCARAGTLTCPAGATRTGSTCVVQAEQLCPSGDRLRILSCGTGRMWDLSALGKPAPRPALAGHTGPVFGVAFAPGGTVLATASGDRTARLWDVSAPAQPTVAATLAGHGGAVNALAFAPSGHLLATASSDRTVRLWDVSAPARATTVATLPAAPAPVLAVAFAPGGRLLAEAGVDGRVRLWDVSAPARPRALAAPAAPPEPVNGLAFTPDGHAVAAAAADGTVRRWDITDPARPRTLTALTAVPGQARAVAFGLGGALLAVVGERATARLWDVSAPQAPVGLTALAGYSGTVNGAAFSPDGRWFATVGDDGTTRLWDLDPDRLAAAVCGRPDGMLTRAEWASAIPGVPYRSPCG